MAVAHHGYGLTGNGDLQGTAETLTGRHGVEKLVYVFERVGTIEIWCCQGRYKSGG